MVFSIDNILLFAGIYILKMLLLEIFLPKIVSTAKLIN